MDQPKMERMLRLMRLMASNTNYTCLTVCLRPLAILKDSMTINISYHANDPSAEYC